MVMQLPGQEIVSLFDEACFRLFTSSCLSTCLPLTGINMETSPFAFLCTTRGLCFSPSSRVNKVKMACPPSSDTNVLESGSGLSSLLDCNVTAVPLNPGSVTSSAAAGSRTARLTARQAVTRSLESPHVWMVATLVGLRVWFLLQANSQGLELI